MTPSYPNRHADKIALVFVFAVIGSSTIWWTLKDKTPPPWDPSDHMIAAYDYYCPIAHADFSGLAKEFFIKTHYYAPLVHLGTAVFFLVFGASRLTGIGVNLVSLAMLLASVYWIGNRLYISDDPGKPDPGGFRAVVHSFANPAVLAALMAACYHFPAWLIHDAFLDYPLTAMVAISVALLIRAGDFQNRRAALLFGLSAGLGMLTKQTFAFFLLLPALYVVGRTLVKRDGRAIVNLVLAGVLASAVAAVWYGPHLKDVIAIYRMNQQAAMDENEAPLFSFMSNTVYIHGLLSMQVQVVFGLLFLAGSVYQAWRWNLARKGRPHLYSGGRTALTGDSLARGPEARLILYLWILSGIVCFTFVANKDMRYTVPVLPAVALVSVSWLSGALLRRPSDKTRGAIDRTALFVRRLKGIAAALIVVWAFVSLANAQWPRAGMGYYIDTPRFRWMVYARNYFGFDHKPLPEDWGVPEIVTTMSGVASDAAATHTPKLGVVVNLPYLNPSSVALYARLQSQGRAAPPIVTMIWLVTKSAADQIPDCDYLLVRTGLDRAEWLAPLERYAEDLINANPSRFTKIAAFPIPMEGGAEAVLYKCEKERAENRAD